MAPTKKRPRGPGSILPAAEPAKLHPALHRAFQLDARRLQADLMKLDAELDFESHGPGAKSPERLADYLIRRFDLIAEAWLALAAMGAEESALQEYEYCLQEQCKETVGLVFDPGQTLLTPGHETFVVNVEARLRARLQHWVGEALTRQVERGQTDVLPDLKVLVTDGSHDSPHIPHATAWNEISIRFVSDFRVQVTIGGVVLQPSSYAEMGFEDRRSQNPNLAWETLRELAARNGVVASTHSARNWRKLERRMQEIRKTFRKRFELKSDPIPYTQGAYRAQFKLELAPHLDFTGDE